MSPMAQMLAAALYAASIRRSGSVPVDTAAARPPRLCLVCQKPHTHNNAFCSAACCRIHQSRGAQR